MILVETERLNQAVADQKAQVLLLLGKHHAVKEFSTRVELVEFMDPLIEDLVTRFNAPRGLANVWLFCRTPEVAGDVQKRMGPGQVLKAFHAPECWPKFWALRDQLKELGGIRLRSRGA